MSAPTWRPSGVAGLVIYGTPGWYSLYWQAPDGQRRLSLGEARYGDRLANQFRLVRDAKAAAARLADWYDWASPTLPETFSQGKPDDLRRGMIERLTGRTIADLEAEFEAQRAATRAEYDGTAARDATDER